MRTASLLWVGSEAKIAGFRPTWYAHFDDKTERTPQSQQARIDDAVALLRLPPADRPHFIAIYYSEPDHEGHEFGPDAPQTRAAALKVDAIVGKLEAALKATGLPIDLVIVSDHGMVKSQGEWITLDQFADLAGFEPSDRSLYGKTEDDRARVYNQLKQASPQFVVYRLKNVPADLNYNQNPREGDPSSLPPALRHSRPCSAGRRSRSATHPRHARLRSAHHARNESQLLRRRTRYRRWKNCRSFENVNLYPWLAHMLGLNPPKSDGSLNMLSGTLRDGGVDSRKINADDGNAR